MEKLVSYSIWLLCTLLSSLICQTEQAEHPLSIKVYAEETDLSEYGAWVLNVEWRDDGFAEKNEPRKVSYDVEIFHTENMAIVHNETIHVMPDNTTLYRWKWTSPIPLQCTSHSVRLRRRDQNHIGEWTPLSLYKGQDHLNARESSVYPRNQFFMVGSNVTFCCILMTVPKADSIFRIPISNRTYISKPLHFDRTSDVISDVHCDDNNGKSKKGASVFIGYPPDDQNLTCMTRDLSSVECHWELGRKTRLEKIDKTIYKLNGRVCDFNRCVLDEVPKQVTNWTLIAKNALGEKTLTDTADPTHRVWLRAPTKLSHAAYARNVTLLWSWDVENDESIIRHPMICQAILNGSIYNKSEVGLKSIDLVHLQPFTEYTVKLKCGSNEHFYKWSDESEITFSTKEDIPEAVDVWIQYFKQNTYVMWKPQQSHGIITQYEITKGKGRKIIDTGINRDDTKLCHKITHGNERNDQKITVSARNSAGLSPPSTIIVPGYPDNEVEISQIRNHTGGFEIVWDEYFNSTCGYVVEWFPTYNETQCAVEWTKIPECDHTASCSWRQDGFEEGVKYTVSVYACTDDKPMLLQRHEGYAKEQRPSGTVQKLGSSQNGESLELSWDEVPVKQQNGFILGYKVIMFRSDSKTHVKTVVTKEPKVNLTLDPGTYTFNVSASTSGGDGDNATLRVEVTSKTGQIITTTVIGCSAATLIFIIITVLSFRKRKWLKKLLYPDIPEPTLAGKWNTKGIYCTQMTEGYMKCEIQEVYSSECSVMAESQHGLISYNSTVCPVQHSYQNTDFSYCLPPSSCAEKLTSIIENPSYNMAFSEPVDVAQISELTLEMQDNYLPAPDFQKNVVSKDSSGYKPQSF